MQRRSSARHSDSSSTIKSPLKQIKKKTFIHQTSPLDFETLRTNPMRGFFTCFCVGMCMVFLLTLLNNYKQHGYLLGLKLAAVFTKDIISLIKYDMIMILSTFVIVPFQRILSFGFLSPSFGTGIQVIVMLLIIASVADVVVLLLDIMGLQ
jgi:hypothetical protein